ncbi:MAG TPA: signal peptide peptidase SppA [Syntrophales bacterium]|nr:signal peptide peptidase SppA [Syntrophales bacterium]
MEATDFSNGQIWGILPDSLDMLVRSYLDIRDRKDLPAEAARYVTSGPGADEKPYTMLNGAAVIPVNGTITKRASFMSMIYGGASAAGIIHSLKTAQADAEVKAIVLSIDSPGGTVSSVESLEEAVRNADAVKPVVAFGNGIMASAAYWIGSAARTVIVENTAQVGSIGVLMVHYDWSESDRQMGLKRTFISAGRYKALGNDAEPLSQEARDKIESQLNHYYSLFVDAVARNRRTDVQAVLDNMADGRVFIGKQAVEAGLADRTGNIEAAVNTALAFATGSGAKGGISIKAEQVAETSITGTEAGKTERQRIMGLAMRHFGEEDGKRFKALVESGVSVEQYATVRKATPALATPAETEEDRTMARMLAALKESRTEQGGKDFITLVAETVVATNCSRTEAMKAIIRKHPEAHKAYIQKMNL